MSEKMKKRIVMCVVGVLLCGIAIGFFKRALFGVDPFQSLMSGLQAMIPISFGTLYVIVNAILLLFSLIFDRHYIHLATFINLFFLGYIVQWVNDLLFGVFPNLPLIGRIVCLVIGIVMACIAASLYFTADLGVSTYDAIALIITQTWKIGQFKYVRVITDFVCVVSGISLYMLAGNDISNVSSIVGVGTILTAFFMGPLIEWFNQHLSLPLLKGKDNH